MGPVKPQQGQTKMFKDPLDLPVLSLGQANLIQGARAAPRRLSHLGAHPHALRKGHTGVQAGQGFGGEPPQHLGYLALLYTQSRVG